MFKPLNDRVLVRPDEVKEESYSGIIVPKDKNEKASSGIVQMDGNSVKAGDHILFSAFGFDEAEINKKTFYLVSEASILGIF